MRRVALLALSLLVVLVPVVVRAQPTEPVPIEPVAADPVVSDPVVSDPVTASAVAATAEPVVAEPPDRTSVSVRYDKGLVFATADETYQLKLSLRSQFRFESTRPTDDGAEVSSRMYIPRARLSADGHVFGDDTRFKLELSLGDRGSFGFVRDLYVEQRLAEAPVWLRAGQWKRPFNRQELVADFGSELNERAITAEFAGGGRDLGIALHDDYEKSPDGLEWAVGVFNSFSGGADRPIIDTTCTPDAMMALDCTTPAPTNFPADFAPAVVARAGWNHGGIKGYSEGDLEGGGLRLAVGAAYKVDLADVTGDLSHGAQLDAMLKVDGLSVEVGGFLMKLKTADARVAAMIQAGYFVVPKHVQVAARVAFVPTTGSRKLLEGRVALSWFWQGHAWKLATDAGALEQTGEDPVTLASDKPDLQLRVMAQLTL